jgi:hypothetical protein
VDRAGGVMALGDRWPKLPKLTDAERDEVHRMIDAFADESARQRSAHVDKLERLAMRLGEQVGRGEMTVDVAAGRIDAMAYALDPAVPVPCGILPSEIGRGVALYAYASGIRKARGRVA